MKKIMTLLTLSVIVLIVSAQPDFSGKWKLNKEKSTLNDEYSMAPAEIIINQMNDTLLVEKHVSFQGNDFTINDKFTLDGKECINPGMMDTKKKSTALFTSGNDSLAIISKLPMEDGSEMTIKEIFLLIDGNFIVNSTASSSWGEMKERMVYDKQ